MPPVAAKPKSKASAKKQPATERSESPTAAEEELAARDGGADASQDQLEQRAKEQKAQQADQLKQGAKAAKDAAKLDTIPEQRANRPGETPLMARVDNMTRRSDEDALEGHFCTIDLSNKDAKAGVEAQIGEGNARPGSGDYGVYLEPGAVGEDGYPVTARVQLRDEHAAVVVVPYAALYPAQAGRR